MIEKYLDKNNIIKVDNQNEVYEYFQNYHNKKTNLQSFFFIYGKILVYKLKEVLFYETI